MAKSNTKAIKKTPKKTTPKKTTQKKRGKKCLYTPKMLKDLCSLIAGGNFAKDACVMVGISETTFYQWMDPDKTPLTKRQLSEFTESIKKAKVRQKANFIKTIATAAKDGKWQAAAWFLERVYNKEFAIKTINELTGKDGGPIETKSTDFEDWFVKKIKEHESSKNT